MSVVRVVVLTTGIYLIALAASGDGLQLWQCLVGGLLVGIYVGMAEDV